MHATDIAVESALAGMPFRDAYRRAAESKNIAHARTPEASLQARVSPGGAADLRLDTLRDRLAQL